MALCNLCSPDGTGVAPSQCELRNLPRDIVELATPLYQACGGRLYRLHVSTDARFVNFGNGLTVEQKLNALERSLATNSRVYFQDNIAGRDGLTGLTPGDMCFVKDASADTSVKTGPAMYMWIDTRSWQLFYKGLSPLDTLNMIQENGGLKVDSRGKVYVDFSGVPSAVIQQITNQLINYDSADPNGTSGNGYGLVADPTTGKLTVNAKDLASNGLAAVKRTGSSLYTKLQVNPKTGGGLACDASGVYLRVNPTGGLAINASGELQANPKTGGGLASDANGLYLRVNPKGALAINASGELEVDFDKLDVNDKRILNKVKTALRLPMWLTVDKKNFYVDGTNGTDPTVDNYIEGKGETEATAFRSIQKCINYICNNFNLGATKVTVLIRPGHYSGGLTLGTYTATTGQIILKPNPNPNYASEGNVVIQNLNYGEYTADNSACRVMGDYAFRDLVFLMQPPAAGSNKESVSAVYVQGKAHLSGCRFQVDFDQYSCTSNYLAASCLHVDQGAIAYLATTEVATNKPANTFEISRLATTYTSQYIYILDIKGTLSIMGLDSYSTGELLIKANNATVLCLSDGGLVRAYTGSRSGQNKQYFNMASDYSIPQKGFRAINGGRIFTGKTITVGGTSRAYFPGPTPPAEGTDEYKQWVESASYSCYN